ncbi:MAG: glycosyltransferase family 4 protein [Williamsia herbipolensis]|nr:glycosyltransferase family 4 protein [Williamsia herbipolensis]
MSERRVEDFRGRAPRALDRVLAASTDEWIGNSGDVCDFVVRAHHAPAARVHQSRNAVDTAVFHPGPPRAQHRPARIGALGRLTEQKGFDVLLDAVRRLGDGVELTIVGDGELRDELTRQAAGLPVTFAGHLSDRRAVADFLRDQDVFAMPSRFEGLPNAPLEALACGTPVVATDVAGMREAVGDAALLVPVDDAAALAEGLGRVLDGDRGGERRGAVSPPRTFDDVARDHLRVFEVAVARRRR